MAESIPLLILMENTLLIY